jgi:8-oxo-dGTP pyrophosphatase MutT (NUDIX family)
MPTQPRPAAAIILLRSQPGSSMETFMVRRHIMSDFVPDVYVFPGGSVKQADRDAETTPNLCLAPAIPQHAETDLGTGLRVAAIREVFEEAGVLLAERGGRLLDVSAEETEKFASYSAKLQNNEMTLAEIAQQERLQLATQRLTLFAHWITPEPMPKRFDTFFFIAEAPLEQQASHDQLETSAGTWIAPGEALARHEKGEFPLVFATIHQLRDLATFPNAAAAEGHLRHRAVPTIIPRATMRGGEIEIFLPGEPGYDELAAGQEPSHEGGKLQ